MSYSFGKIPSDQAYTHLRVDDLIAKRLTAAVANIQASQPAYASFGWWDYNDTSSAAGLPILANTWTDLPNNGQGAASTSLYAIEGAGEILDPATGYLDLSGLEVGDTIVIRNDFTVTPSLNNSSLSIRFYFDTPSPFTLPTILKRLDVGTVPYRTALTTDSFYIGSTGVRDSPVRIQIQLSEDGTFVNAGSFIQVFRPNKVV